MLVIAFAQLADGGRASEGSNWAGRWSKKLLLAVCPSCIINGGNLGAGIIPKVQQKGSWFKGLGSGVQGLASGMR